MTKKLKNHILKHLKNLNIKKNDNVLVYSDLSKFGFYNKNLAKIIISSIKNTIGKNGTIVMPFYILENNSNYIFNIKKFSLNNKIGILTKQLCKEKKIVRSNSLIHNHIGKGPMAKILSYSSENISIGKKSDFELMKNYNFKLLLLACDPMQGATYLHHLEAVRRVPYRKWITVKKRKIENNLTKIVRIRYFAKKNNKYVSDFNNLFIKFKKLKNILFEQKVKYGKSFCISLKDLDKVATKLLNKNKYSFVKKVK